MGQAFRRATGRIGSATTSSQLKKPLERKPPLPTENVVSNVGAGAESIPKANSDNVLEERDPQYDAMLSQMVGRIQSKPGGKPEMGEAVVVEKYERPMPKLRNTTVESSRYEERPAPPGTLNVAQLRQIMLLYQGKANDHDGPMNIEQIAQHFKVDATLVQSIVHSVSLPSDDTTKKFNNH